MTNSVGSAYTVTTTTNTAYITNISAATIALQQPLAIKRFVPMKRHVDTQMANSSQRISMRNIHEIESYSTDIPSLYYVQNGYNSDGFESCDVTLYRFEIVKTTECYYFLRSGQRISKQLKGRTFAKTPTEALGKSIERANNYLEILIRRGKNVAEFLGKVSGQQGKDNRELREFAKIVETLKNPDEVPSELFKKFSHNPRMFEEDTPL